MIYSFSEAKVATFVVRFPNPLDSWQLGNLTTTFAALDSIWKQALSLV